MQLEVCCGSLEDVLVAHRAGAKRIELNVALETGGLTAHPATVRKIKEKTDLEVVCMVRPRIGGFCYSEADYQQMRAEAFELLMAGADGLSFGFLNEDTTVNRQRTREFCQMCHAGRATAVFHRAIDVTDHIDNALQAIIDTGCDRVLTSGGEANAILGLKTLQHLQERYGSMIEILPGCGITQHNATLFAPLGFPYVHASCKEEIEDPTVSHGSVSFALPGSASASTYWAVSEQKVANLLDVLSKCGDF